MARCKTPATVPLHATDARFPALDMLRGGAVLWMTAFHFAFDLNHFGFIQQDFYRAPLWTVQRTCILSLFLFCAGFGQAMAVRAGQSWGRFWRRWLQIAACAVAVSVGSAVMFPHSWIYFGVLHGMAVMLILCRLTAGWRLAGLWTAGAVAIAAGWWAAPLQALLPVPSVWDTKPLNWVGLISTKPITEDYVPLLPWLGVMWWGMAVGRLVQSHAWFTRWTVREAPVAAALAWVGRWSLSWYMVHQPVLIGLLSLAVLLRG